MVRNRPWWPVPARYTARARSLALLGLAPWPPIGRGGVRHSPLRARRAAERASVGTVRPRGWVHPSIRKAGVFEPPRYSTRLADVGPEIRLKSPMISEMVLWEWEIQEPRKVEEWRLPGRAPAVRTPQPSEWTDGYNPEVERCGWRHARAGGPNLTTTLQMARFRQQPQPQTIAL